MKTNALNRRQFLAAATAGSVATVVSHAIPAYADVTQKAGKLALLGGEPVRKNKSWPKWPYWDDQVIDSVVKTTKSRIWCRIDSPSGTVPTFEA